MAIGINDDPLRLLEGPNQSVQKDVVKTMVTEFYAIASSVVRDREHTAVNAPATLSWGILRAKVLEKLVRAWQ